MERDVKNVLFSHVYVNFNSHAHVERDSGVRMKIQRYLHFNSHAHVERDDYDGRNDNNDGNFNSHAHVERDLMINHIVTIRPISTHTLTWSVTNARRLVEHCYAISTHTLTWSVTLMLCISGACST